MKNRRRLTVSRVGMISVCLAAATFNAVASEGQIPSWQRGVSKWNGSSYEDLTDDVAESHTESKPADESTLPYNVPSDPSEVRANPYYQSPSIAELQRALETSGQRDPIGEDDLSVDPIVDPYGSVNRSTPTAVTTTGYVEAPENSPNSDSTATAGNAVEQAVGDEETDSQLEKVQLAQALAEQPPLEQEVIHWYQYPQRWMRGWDSHAEFGIDGSNGNADTLALQTGLELKRVTDLYTIAIDADYRQASTGSTTTEDNGRLNIDYDRMLADSYWSAFGKLGLEWDEFKAFDLRVNLNGGFGFHWIREENTTLVTRFGAGASREIGAPVDEWTPEAVFGIDAEHQLNSRNKLKGKLDYFPAWEDFSDFRVVADAAWEILLDESDNLSLKIAITDRYDSTPQGARPNDVYYSLLLLYKF